MSETAHYRFPPSSAYALNRCLYSLKSDRQFAERFLADAQAVAWIATRWWPAAPIRTSCSWPGSGSRCSPSPGP